jgi:cell wall-associated NlpC family hydrolase
MVETAFLSNKRNITMLLPTGRYRVSVPSINIRLTPDINSALDDQGLFGDDLEVLKVTEDYAYVHLLCDGKKGWIDSPAAKLVSSAIPLPSRTHRVARPRIIAFREPSGKSEQSAIFSMNSKLTIRERSGQGADEFGQVVGLAGGEAVWVRMNGLMPVQTFFSDFVAVQEMFAGVLYKWGCRDASPGIDCSSLKQQSHLACGWEYCPRDTKDQVNDPLFGQSFDFPSRALGLKRGDAIYFPGHVVTMVDENRCIHATDLAPYHCVLVQDLSQVIAERVAADLGLPTKVRRLLNHGR